MADKEMLDIFVAEVVEIKKELTGYLSSMVTDKIEDVDRSYFEKYGQAIDRIYGTAATMGHTEIAAYCKAIKDVTYMASNSDNSLGHKKVIRMMIECTQVLEQTTKWVYEKDQAPVYKNKLIAEVKRAERLNRQEFYSIEKKSCG